METNQLLDSIKSLKESAPTLTIQFDNNYGLHIDGHDVNNSNKVKPYVVTILKNGKPSKNNPISTEKIPFCGLDDIEILKKQVSNL
tara:strand:+ start:7311 stop:7568 length:258 start_codon:yes stop_codon:yes gene_type:complete